MFKKYKNYYCMLRTFDGKYTFAIKKRGNGYNTLYSLMVMKENRRLNTIKELLCFAYYYPWYKDLCYTNSPEMISYVFGRYKGTTEVIDIYKYKEEFTKIMNIYEYIMDKNVVNRSSYIRFKNILNIYFEYRDKINEILPYL